MGADRNDSLAFIVGEPCGLVDSDAAYKLVEDANRLCIELAEIVKCSEELFLEFRPQAGTERRPERESLPYQLGLVRGPPFEAGKEGGSRPFRSYSEKPRRADCQRQCNNGSSAILMLF